MTVENKDIYIDWSRAPQGTTQVYCEVQEDFNNGVADYIEDYERIAGYKAFEWSGGKWTAMNEPSQSDALHGINRIQKPDLTNNNSSDDAELVLITQTQTRSDGKIYDACYGINYYNQSPTDSIVVGSGATISDAKYDTIKNLKNIIKQLEKVD